MTSNSLTPAASAPGTAQHADNNRTVRGHSGTYTADGDTYRERIVYGSGTNYERMPSDWREVGVTFSCRRTGDAWRIEASYQATPYVRPGGELRRAVAE